MTFKPSETLPGHEGIVSSLRFSPDGCMLASASVDQTARVWDIASSSSAAKQRFEGHTAGLSDVCWHPSQSYVATASDDLSLGMWNVETGKRLQTFKGHTHFVFCCKFHPYGNILVRSQPECIVPLLTVTGWELPLTRFSAPPFPPVTPSMGCVQVSGSLDESVRFWDVRSGQSIKAIPAHSDPVTGLDITSCASLLTNVQAARLWPK